MKSTLLAAAILVLLRPASADAQQMKLELHDGRVTLDAQNVPVRQILAEWARLGGAKIVNGEKVVGAPVTLQLQDVPERQALDIILRNVSGYALAARQDGSAGVSAFDRILILPTSSAPRNQPGPAAAATPFGQPGAMGGRMVQQPVIPVVPAEVSNDPDEEPATDVPEEENEEQPQPEAPPAGRRSMFPTATPLVPQFQPPPPFNTGGNPNPNQTEAPPGQAPPMPGNPFGVPAGTSTVPGVVIPAPPNPQGQQQPTTTRPPI